MASEEKDPQPTDKNPDEGDKPATNDPLAEVRTLKQELDEARKEAVTVRDELKALRTRDILGGETNAGTVNEPPKEETPAEYTKRVMAGQT